MTGQNKVAATPLTLGVVFLYIGVVQGGYRDASQKAVRVCLGCIEIG